MKGFRKYFLSVFSFLLCGAVFLAVAFFPRKKEEAKAEKRVVRIWNVDTFEGGKGSRTAFLKKVASRVEKKADGVYYMVNGYTREGALAAYEAGDRPDVLSYGMGLNAFAESCLPMSGDFAGGEKDGKTLAYPWCRGGYALFSLTEGFSQEANTVISCGGENLSQVAAALANVSGEECPSQEAYVRFLNGEFRYLLGTQRDFCRFLSRNMTVSVKPLTEYCDLYQYVSVLSSEKQGDCSAFVEELLSSRTQEDLSSIGMYSVSDQNDFLGESVHYTASVFSTVSELEHLRTISRSEEEIKNIVKFLKTV